jgi:hypothetical protein
VAWRERAISLLEDTTGLTLQPKALVDRLQENNIHLEQFRAEAAELAYHTLDYFGGRPQEMVAESRKRLVQRSRVAFIHDPLAGAEAGLLANFSLGQGVEVPKAADERVQKIIDRAWMDPTNFEMFTSPSAQRRSSNSLLTQGNLLDTLYAKGGRIRVGKLAVDDVQDIVPDPEFRLRPIYYVGLRRKYRWNVEHDRPDFEAELEENGKPKVTYYPHWRNLRDAEQERKDIPGLEPLPVIPKEKQDPGGAVVYHTAINQLDEQLWGNPPWARTLRFYSAMNQFTEARVAMAQAASTFIARRVTKGGPSDVVKAAGAVLAQTGELGTSELGGSDPLAPTQQQPGGLNPPLPGSWWVENEQSKLESLSLQSGAAAAQQDAAIIRSPLSAATSFGQHYLGDASNANLATATSLELPALMAVLAWQEVHEARLRWFVDRAIETAAQAGEFGGIADPESESRLSELRLCEADEKAELERRTKVKFDYSFSMPYPGRRNLPDVTGTVTSILAVGEGLLIENDEMMREALTFLFTHGWQVMDPAESVERVMKAHRKLIDERVKMAEKLAKEQAQLGAGGTPVDVPTDNPSTRSGDTPAGATPAKQEMGGAQEQEWLPAELRAPVDEFATETQRLFATTVAGPAIVAALKLGGHRNGDGEHVGA